MITDGSSPDEAMISEAGGLIREVGDGPSQDRVFLVVVTDEWGDSLNPTTDSTISGDSCIGS